MSDIPSLPEPQAAKPRRWRLLVISPPPDTRLIHKIGLVPLRDNPRHYVAYYRAGAKAQLLRHIEMLKAAGLHGQASRVKGDRLRRKTARPKVERSKPLMIDGRRYKRAWDDAPFNRSYAELKQFATKLRDNPTLAEQALWGHLAAGRLGVRVRRQHVLVGYIADFFIPAWRIAIELDGSSHERQADYDARRDHAIKRNGFRVMRFPNSRALNNPLSVVWEIAAAGRGDSPAACWPTLAEIDAARTPAGGWTAKTLASWGVPWPPPKGWRAKLLGGPPVALAEQPSPISHQGDMLTAR